MNFKEVEIFTDIEKKRCSRTDVRKDLANMIYNGSNGIAAHALALKIYNSDGDIELNEEEKEIVRQVANAFCTPAFIDAIDKLFT